MLFAGWEVRMVENCDRGRENAALARYFFETWRNSFRKNPNDLGL